nr:hypothetical protein [Tanacetum cinerariifolium]
MRQRPYIHIHNDGIDTYDCIRTLTRESLRLKKAQEKDKIRSKRDENEKRIEAGKRIGTWTTRGWTCAVLPKLVVCTLSFVASVSRSTSFGRGEGVGQREFHRQDHFRAPDSPDQFHCFHCKDVLRAGETCKRCTCAKCGSGRGKGLCYICGHNQNSLNDSSSISETSSQSPPNINHCCYECGDSLDGIFCKRCPYKSCGKDAHIGYNCPSKVPVISNPEPCNNQTIDELPQTLPIFHPTFHSEAESPFTLDSIPTYVDESPNVFKPPPQPSVYPCEFCGNDAYYGHYCTPQAPLIYPEPCYNQDFNFPQYFQDVPQQYPCCDDCGLNSTLANIQDQMTSITSLCEIACHFVQKKREEKQIKEEQATKAQNWKPFVCCDDDDEEESSKSLKDNIIFELPSCVAVTPNEPVDSLIMGDEHLNTISATESNEFIKSCVENLVPNPSESEGRNGCDMPPECTTFLKVLCDAECESDSSDDQSCSDEDVLEKIVSKPLCEEEIIPIKIDQHPDNAESDLMKSLRIDETDCDFEKDIHLIEKLLYDNSSPRPPKEFVFANSDAATESFSPSPILVKDSESLMEEIDLFSTPDYPMPPGIEDEDSESERDILIPKDLPRNSSLSFAEKESIHFDIPPFSCPPAKPPDGDTGILNIQMMGDISDQKAFMHQLMITLASHQEKSPDLLSHRCETIKTFNTHRSHLNKFPMMINGQNNPPLDVLLFHFYPP